jgi:hypothetical protein
MSAHTSVIAGLEFHPNEHGWVANVPTTRGVFQGHPVRITIATRVLAYEPKELPRPNGDQIRLATFLMENLGDVLFECAIRLRSYCGDLTFFTEMVSPELWISAEEESDGPMSWTMVVERRGDEDDGYHIEFDGLQFVQIFSYDDTYPDSA